MIRRFGAGLALAAGAAFGAAPATAQVQVAIGTFSSSQSCTTYTLTSGSVAAAGSHTRVYGLGSRTALAYAAAWRTELVRDCVDNFPELRASLASALAASRNLVVVPPGTPGAIVLNGRVSDVGTSSTTYASGDMNQESSEAALTVDFSLEEADGGTRFGNSISKRVSSGEGFNSAGLSTTSSSSGQSVYNNLQRELALAVARSVTFEVEPLRVVAVVGKRARVNYGAPLVTLGATVLVDGGPGRGQIRCNVVSAGHGFADIESEAGHSLEGIAVGSRAMFAEADDPAANGRRVERVELP